MIQLFNIPNHTIDTSGFKNILHDPIVQKLENEFASYVGAKYACSINSATNAIFLAFNIYQNLSLEVEIPTMLPCVVANSIINSGHVIHFNDNIEWIGNSYILHRFKDYKIVDSAQKVEKDQFIKECDNNDLMIFSFYPTKPISGIDGGMIVSNDKDKIDWFRLAVFNGTTQNFNNWDRQCVFPGWKMYMSSVQAYVVYQNFLKLENKKKKLNKIRDYYNNYFNSYNESDHLYRIEVDNNDSFIDFMKQNKIICGKHYPCLHKSNVYSGYSYKDLRQSEYISQRTVSIPFHENLTKNDLEYIIERYNEYHKF